MRPRAPPTWWLGAVAWLLALGWGGHLGTAAAYSLTDPTADHTDQGIQYDQAGKKDLALKSFKAAVRYENTRPIGERLSNLGVIFMRMERFQESSSAMVEAMSYKVAGLADASTSEHIQGNWDNLMTNLDYQRIERPAMPTGAEEERAAGWAAKDDKSAAKQNKQQQKKKKKKAPQPTGLTYDGWTDFDEDDNPPQDAAVAKVRAELTAIYQKHNPEKVGDVDKLLSKYSGKEAKLLRKVKHRYNVDGLPRQAYKLHIPRVTAEELAANKTLMSGHWPYVLVGEVEKWPAMKKWTLDYLQKKIPSEWVDFYPYNMYKMGNKPYVQPYREALPKFRQKTEHSKYMQMRLSLSGWEALVPDLAPLPPEFWTEAEWINECMATSNGTRDAEAIDNFFRVNQWNFLLIGEKGTGIFFHKDHLAAASWQAAVVGRKRWILCPYDQNHLLSEELYTFRPDYRSHTGQNFAKAFCGDVTVHPGEIVYYPSYWWHQTKNLDTPTIGLTGLMVGAEDQRTDLHFSKVHEQFFHDLQKKCKNCWKMDGSRERTCDDISTKWPGAAPPPSFDWCHTYLNRCYRLWDQKGSRDLAQARRRNSMRKSKNNVGGEGDAEEQESAKGSMWSSWFGGESGKEL